MQVLQFLSACVYHSAPEQFVILDFLKDNIKQAIKKRLICSVRFYVTISVHVYFKLSVS